MSPQSNSRAVVAMQPGDVAHTQGFPSSRLPLAHEIIGRILRPVLALLSVVLLWWVLYLIFPRLLPSPLSTCREAVRLLSEGTFFFHMFQSIRRVFVGAAVAMLFSIAVGIYMGTVVMGERFFQPLVVVGLTIPG